MIVVVEKEKNLLNTECKQRYYQKNKKRYWCWNGMISKRYLERSMRKPSSTIEKKQGQNWSWFLLERITKLLSLKVWTKMICQFHKEVQEWSLNHSKKLIIGSRQLLLSLRKIFLFVGWSWMSLNEELRNLWLMLTTFLWHRSLNALRHAKDLKIYLINKVWLIDWWLASILLNNSHFNQESQIWLMMITFNWESLKTK